jgi:hypothetical protein
MGFLKKLGQVIINTVGIVAGVGPLIGPLIPASERGVIDTLTVLHDIIVKVEVVGQSANLSGQQKLAAATPMVTQALLTALDAAGYEVDNPDLVKQGATSVTSGLADILNGMKRK